MDCRNRRQVSVRLSFYEFCQLPHFCSAKLAQTLSKTVASLNRDPLNIFLQVNTSNEAQKSGVHPDEVLPLVTDIVQNKDNLYSHITLQGFMTIGNPDGNPDDDFQVLVSCRKRIVEALGISETKFGLSMGMSGDYKAAIKMGSTNVRVGSIIFGARPKKVASETAQETK